MTGWKIDIKSASDFQAMLDENPNLREEFSQEKETEKLVDDILQEMDEVLSDDAGAGLLDDDSDTETDVLADDPIEAETLLNDSERTTSTRPSRAAMPGTAG